MTDTKQNTRISQFRFGQPKESLKLEHVALGALDKDKVRVQIEATNINPSDLLSIYGVGQYKHSHQPPRVPGFEAVGRVVESSHAEFATNQRVLVATSGTWQNYVDVSPDDLFQIPQHLENGYACQLYINALTAWVLTTEVAKLTQEDVLIINAGRTAIGKIFSQLSESLGFKIIVVTSQPKQYPTVAFDAIGGSPGTDLIHTLSNKGRFINYGTLSLGFYEPRFFEHAKSQDIDFSTFFLRYWEEVEGKGVRRDKFTTMLDHFITNDIQLDVDRYLPFDEVQTAIDLIESKTTRLNGKIILLPV
ncbi:zinc-dependent alcohol dehydrogenase family protein [Vibrio sp. 10N.237.312.B06]|uniref:zinc-dependent alcohol dehydrogenase family protein n=1 Tax=Vibrio sp. 10N.237.312.B06 TaxID=3229974 RepID=UPI003550CD09